MVSDEQYPGPPPVTTSAVPSSVPPAAAVPSSAGPGAATATRRPRRGRRVLLIVAIVVAFLLLLGGTIGVVAYDKATAIDRSTPTVVIRQFMEAAALDHDSTRVGLFVCQGWSAADAMSAEIGRAHV